MTQASTLPNVDEELAADAGELIINSALLRLIADLSHEQDVALAHYLEDEPAPEILMQHLFEHYPQFGTILKEEIEVFQTELNAILPPEEAIETQ